MLTRLPHSYTWDFHVRATLLALHAAQPPLSRPHLLSYRNPQTPEFRLASVLLSSPFTLLFCIWGMTSQHGKKLLPATASLLARSNL